MGDREIFRVYMFVFISIRYFFKNYYNKRGYKNI